jgi:hypothetical protein
LKMTQAIVFILMCSISAGCGSASYTPAGPGGSVGQPGTMLAGQWEFVLTPAVGNSVYLEANLSISNGSVSATQFNTAVFANAGSILYDGCLGDGPSNVNYIFGLQTIASLTNGVLSGAAAQPSGTPGFSFSSATIANDGQSVSGGSYTIPSNANMCVLPAGSSGKFSGIKVSPLNGTFTGTITGFGLTDQITITITQDSNFGITASGTDLSPGVSTALSISPSGTPSDFMAGFSNTIGAAVEATGVGVNASGTQTFNFFGHFDSAATQIEVQGLFHPLAGESETGRLTKQ